MYAFGIAYFFVATGVNALIPTILIFVATFIKDILCLIPAFYIAGIIRKRIIK